MLTEQEFALLERAEQDGFLDIAKLTDAERSIAHHLKECGYLEKSPQKSCESSNDFREMLNKHTEQKHYKRHYYRNLILRSVSAFFVGVIIKALFNVGGLQLFVLGLLLVVLGALFVKFF